MGSFLGHAIPGSFLFIFGFWWTFQSIRKYFRSLTKTGPVFRSTVTPTSNSRQIDIEGLVATCLAIIGMIIELVISEIVNHHDVGMGNIQHATMYFFFGMLGVVSIFAPVFRKFIPEYEKFRFILLALSFAVEGLLFKFHLFGRNNLDVMLHTLLLYAIYVSVIITLIEMMYPENVLLPLARGFLSMLQGTWFWQVAFILYNPLPHDDWNPENHHEMMIIVAYFCWHVAAILVFQCSIFAVVYRCDKGIDMQLEDFPMRMSSKEEGYSRLVHDVDVDQEA